MSPPSAVTTRAAIPTIGRLRSPRKRTGLLTASAARKHDVVALGAKHIDNDVAVVALELDDAVLDRAADTAALLQAAGELAQGCVVEGDVIDGGDSLAHAARHLTLDADAIAGGPALLQAGVGSLAKVAVRRGPDDAAAHRTPTRSTTKISVSSGPMTPPAPRLP